MKEIKATPTESGVIVKEARVFEASREDIRRKINELEHRRQSYLAESAALKKRYDETMAELSEYQKIYDDNFAEKITDFVGVEDEQ